MINQYFIARGHHHGRMSVGEVALKKGYQYVTVISDTQGQAVALVDNRRVDIPAGISLSNAADKIAFNHFHVAKMLCSIVDKIRQGEMRSIPLLARKEAHRSRYLWLYGSKNRHSQREESLEAAQQVLPETSQCWAMKELACELWHRRYHEHSRRLWLEWMAKANAVGVPLLTSAVRTLRKRLYGILNAMKHRVSNGNAESLNSKVRLLRIKARGIGTGNALNWVCCSITES